MSLGQGKLIGSNMKQVIDLVPACDGAGAMWR